MSFTAYDTLATRSIQTDTILNKISLAKVEQETIPLFSPAESQRIIDVKGIIPSNTEIPAFTHPVYHPEDKVFYIDTRTLIKMDSDGNQRLVNLGDYRFQLTRAILNRHWIHYTPNDLLNTGEITPLVFMRWMTGNISRKLGLSAGDQVKVSIVVFFYWYSLFKEDEEAFTEKEKLRIISRLNQISSIPSSYSIETMDHIEPMKGIEDFCQQLQKIVENTRVDMVSPAFIYALLGGSWFGINVKETIAVSVEHPPTFMAMVAEALINRSYRKTQIGTLVNDNDKKGRGDTFNRNLRNILEVHYA